MPSICHLNIRRPLLVLSSHPLQGAPFIKSLPAGSPLLPSELLCSPPQTHDSTAKHLHFQLIFTNSLLCAETLCTECCLLWPAVTLQSDLNATAQCGIFYGTGTVSHTLLLLYNLFSFVSWYIGPRFHYTSADSFQSLSLATVFCP